MSLAPVTQLRPREVVTDDMLDRAMRAFNLAVLRDRTAARAALRAAIEAALHDPNQPGEHDQAPHVHHVPRRSRSGRQVSFPKAVRTLALYLTNAHDYDPAKAARVAEWVLRSALPARQRNPRPQRASDDERMAA